MWDVRWDTDAMWDGMPCGKWGGMPLGGMSCGTPLGGMSCGTNLQVKKIFKFCLE